MKILLTILILIVSSCTLPVKMKKQTDDATVTKIKHQKPDNWANDYYNSTLLLVKNPIIENSYKEMQAICKGDDFLFNSQYQSETPAAVYYKKIPITIKTNDGFVKKVFVNKGTCREITLYKAPGSQQAKQIRSKIQYVMLHYIYNQGSYLKTLVFETKFKDVEFLVE